MFILWLSQVKFKLYPLKLQNQTLTIAELKSQTLTDELRTFLEQHRMIK